MVTRGSELYSGQLIGHLRLVSRKATKKTGPYVERKQWSCRCTKDACGKLISVPEQYLVRDPNPKSDCGEHIATFRSLHKLELNVWLMMHVRCENPQHVGYKHYGAKGVRVCERWHKTNPNGFKNFVEDMGPRKARKYTLDRIDPEGIYEKYKPDGTLQCKWATWTEQNNNKREHKHWNKPKEPKPNQGDKSA